MGALTSNIDAGPAMLAAITTAAFILFKALQAVYRLCFHPLSHFPGPWAASISRNWLWQQIQTEKPEEVFEKLHNDYGEYGHALSSKFQGAIQLSHSAIGSQSIRPDASVAYFW